MLRRILGLSVIAALLVSLSVQVLRWQVWPTEARGNATEAALSIGLDLSAFKGPLQTGSTFFGTDVYHWERPSAGAVVERVTYLREDQRLCWSQQVAGNWNDKGCINTRPFEP
jgi:hypothetical protein